MSDLLSFLLALFMPWGATKRSQLGTAPTSGAFASGAPVTCNVTPGMILEISNTADARYHFAASADAPAANTGMLLLLGTHRRVVPEGVTFLVLTPNNTAVPGTATVQAVASLPQSLMPILRRCM